MTAAVLSVLVALWMFVFELVMAAEDFVVDCRHCQSYLMTDLVVRFQRPPRRTKTTHRVRLRSKCFVPRPRCFLLQTPLLKWSRCVVFDTTPRSEGGSTLVNKCSWEDCLRYSLPLFSLRISSSLNSNALRLHVQNTSCCELQRTRCAQHHGGSVRACPTMMSVH